MTGSQQPKGAKGAPGTPCKGAQRFRRSASKSAKGALFLSPPRAGGNTCSLCSLWPGGRPNHANTASHLHRHPISKGARGAAPFVLPLCSLGHRAPPAGSQEGESLLIPEPPASHPGDSLVKDCVAWIRTTDYVSFAELERWLAERGVAAAGDYCLEIAPNVILWARVSERFCGIFQEMRPHLDLAPCSSLLVYIVDGKMLDLPIAKRAPRAGYAKPRWLPVTLRPKQQATRGVIRGALTGVAAARSPVMSS